MTVRNQNYEKVIEELNLLGSILGLERIENLCRKLGNPQDGLNVIHVAGTNGKGSVSRMIYSILRESGYSVGLYTSPFLETFNERIEVNGQLIEDYQLDLLMKKVASAADEIKSEGLLTPTEFDAVTALAFLYFKEMNVDFVVLEVGLGGRLDSTNIIKHPKCAIITSVSLDHTEVLGDSIREIAMEKAGIIKDNTLVISGVSNEEANEVIKTKAKSTGSKLIESYKGSCYIESMDLNGTALSVLPVNYHSLNVKLSMAGTYQVENALTATTAIIAMRNEGTIKVTDQNIIDGLAKAKNLGRLETIHIDGFNYILDGAHNEAGARALVNSMLEIMNVSKYSTNSPVILTGVLADKDVKGIYQELSTIANEYVLMDVNSPRSLKKENLKDIIIEIDNTAKVHLADSVEEALIKAREVAVANGENYLICCGSLYLIGEIKAAVRRWI